MASSGILQSYTCACLNVRITPQPALGGTSPPSAAGDCTPVYVGEQGLSVVSQEIMVLRERAHISISLADPYTAHSANTVSSLARPGRRSVDPIYLSDVLDMWDPRLPRPAHHIFGR